MNNLKDTNNQINNINSYKIYLLTRKKHLKKQHIKISQNKSTLSFKKNILISCFYFFL